MRRFDEIRLPNKHAIRWRFVLKENCWEIAAYQGAETRLTSVTGELIERRVVRGPGTAEFSEALGMVALSASLKVQSKRINGSRAV
jgi:hypothetical protein